MSGSCARVRACVRACCQKSKVTDQHLKTAKYLMDTGLDPTEKNHAGEVCCESSNQS
jgi:hypothetical protein